MCLTKPNVYYCRIQDLEEPPDEWIEQKDRSGKKFYTNPATGPSLCFSSVCSMWKYLKTSDAS